MLTLEDVILAARTVWAESRGETYRGKLAVAYVILNRWKASHGQWKQDNTLAATCLRAFQFSAWNPDDPNLPKLQKVDLNDKYFRECVRAILEAYDNPGGDPTHGSFHYMTVHRYNQGWPKSWGSKQQPVVTIGTHVFFNNVN
jgi:spore germination cell wall hydrolase CwlJ-like protein